MDLTEDTVYNIATKHYIAYGRDGYEAFTDPSVKWISDDYGALPIQDIIVSAFE